MLLPLVFGLLGGLFAVGSGTVRDFERAAAQDVASKLQGDNKRVEVRVRPAGISGALASATIRAWDFSTDGLPLFTEPERSTRGVVHELRLDLREFDLRGLRVESLEAKISDCRFDYSLAVRRKQIRLSRSGTGRGRVTVRQGDLEKFVVAKYREVRQARIQIDNGRIRVQGEGEFLLIRSPFTVEATLEAREGTRLMLSDAKITFGGVPAEGPAAEAVLRTLNPVVDLDRDLELYGALKIERLLLEDGKLTADGPATIPVRPAT